jgi:hypothetical protein
MCSSPQTLKKWSVPQSRDGPVDLENPYPVQADSSFGNLDATRCGHVISPLRELVFTLELTGSLIC